jgi:hypothetical protein
MLSGIFDENLTKKFKQIENQAETFSPEIVGSYVHMYVGEKAIQIQSLKLSKAFNLINKRPKGEVAQKSVRAFQDYLELFLVCDFIMPTCM